MTDIDFNGHGDAEYLDELFADYNTALGTKLLLDTEALKVIYANAAPLRPIPKSVTWKGWRRAVGPLLLFVWAAVLMSAVWLDARFEVAGEQDSVPATLHTEALPQVQRYSFAPIESGRISSPKPINSSDAGMESSMRGSLPAASQLFRASALVYADNADLDSAVIHDPSLGPEWRLADWNDIVNVSKDHPIQELIHSLKWDLDTGTHFPVARNQFWLQYNGRSTTRSVEQHYGIASNEENSHRHYFVARFDHRVPDNFRVVAGIEDNEIVLGSWYDWKFPVLAVRRESAR